MKSLHSLVHQAISGNSEPHYSANYKIIQHQWIRKMEPLFFYP